MLVVVRHTSADEPYTSYSLRMIGTWTFYLFATEFLLPGDLAVAGGGLAVCVYIYSRYLWCRVNNRLYRMKMGNQTEEENRE